ATVLQPAEPHDAVSRAGWWEVFGDAQLNDLQQQLMRGNPAVAEAQARLTAARALIRQDRAGYFPQVTAGASAARTRTGAASHPGAANETVNEYAANIGASWEPDLWGRVRQTGAASTRCAQAATRQLER